jgi:23S rRNA (uridine2552-2'-O)-methyltransferase
MGNTWQNSKKNEYYYKKAKDSNYYSRASYKLLQLNKKYKIIKNGDSVVDLGSSPGGWSQVALEKVKLKGTVIGIDLNKIRPIHEENFFFIQGDFRSSEVKEKIANILNENILNEKVNVVISDVSPSLTGVKNLDNLRSMDLFESVLNISDSILKNKGNLLVKFFQSDDINKLLKEVKKKFQLVKTTKPNSSRKKSSEMYLIGLGFKK